MTNETKKLVQDIVRWCSKNGQAESRLLYPEPQHYVFTFALIDWLADRTGIAREEVGAWFNAEQERQTKRKARAK